MINNFPLKKKYENKLKLSWNIGLGNFIIHLIHSIKL